MLNTDIVVIGSGVIGSAIARELSKYELDVVLVDRNEDVGGDASKANNGMICTGFDTPPRSLESKMVIASRLM